METRHFWIQKITQEFQRFNVVWLAGVRRTGKTTLCKSLEGFEYFDCEIARIRQLIDRDSEAFLKSVGEKKIVLDEVHRLENPSEILKIAADHFPKVKIIATGSSTLHAKKKFKDTLTDRKSDVWITPANLSDMDDFKVEDLSRRLLHGGLPSLLLSEKLNETAYPDWMDDYWAKDIQELFNVDKRHAFFKFTELIFIRSGGLFDATHFSAQCEVARQTIQSYLEILETTLVVRSLKPFYKNPEKEIISTPKIYAFDTGFVCHYKNWIHLRPDDYGHLWEHFVLNELLCYFKKYQLFYWRSKQKHEVDFICLPRRGVAPVAIECKWSSSQFDIDGIAHFRKLHEEGENFVVTSDSDFPVKKKFKNITVTFVGLKQLVKLLLDLKP